VPRAAALLTPSHEGSNKMLQRRALVVWLVIILAESVHGVLRQLFLVPLVGDLRARQIGVLVGSLIILAIALMFSRLLGARTLREQFVVGFAWVALTLAFELALGAVLGFSPQRMLEDYDLSRGGLMTFGLLFMLSAPAVAARLRGT
jgi:hypothetical protein